MAHCGKHSVGQGNTGVVLHTVTAENLTLNGTEKHSLIVKRFTVAAGNKVGHVTRKSEQSQLDDCLELLVRFFVF